MAVVQKNVRVWAFSFNMEARDPFMGDDPNQVFASCVPTDYDLYVIGLQESPNEDFFDKITTYMAAQCGCVRLSGGGVMSKTKVTGRGDGSLIGKKATQMAIFCKKQMAGAVSSQAVYPFSFGRKEGSKGAVSIMVRVYDMTLCCINCHLAANALPKRQAQYKKIVDTLGNKLGNSFFQLNSQFHHIIWMGDMNFRMSGLEIEDASAQLQAGKFEELHAANDELANEINKGNIYGGYREPIKDWQEFAPTYKKDKYREADHGSGADDPEWVSKTYCIDFKQQWYKGGRTKVRMPGWCDRILYNSLPDMVGTLEPEASPGGRVDLAGAPCDNYFAITGQLMASDHSAIACGFNLKVREVPDLPVSVYKLRIFDAKVSSNVKAKHFKLVTPLPYEVIDRMPAAKKLPMADIAGSSGKSWFFVGMAVGMQESDPDLRHHALVKMTAADIKGECAVPLRLSDFVEGNTVQYTEELQYEGIALLVGGKPLTISFQLEFLKPAGVGGDEDDDGDGDEDEPEAETM